MIVALWEISRYLVIPVENGMYYFYYTTTTTRLKMHLTLLHGCQSVCRLTELVNRIHYWERLMSFYCFQFYWIFILLLLLLLLLLVLQTLKLLLALVSYLLLPSSKSIWSKPTFFPKLSKHFFSLSPPPPLINFGRACEHVRYSRHLRLLSIRGGSPETLDPVGAKVRK